jgi:hypothetical protein
MRGAVIEKMAALVTAAFGLVAALAWNDAIKAIFKRIFGTAEGMGPMLTYALIVTVIAVLVTLWIGKASARMVKED